MFRLSLAAIQRCFFRRLRQRGQDAVVSNAQLRHEGKSETKHCDTLKYYIGWKGKKKKKKGFGAETNHVGPVGLFYRGGLQRGRGRRVGGGECGSADREWGETGRSGQRVALDPRFRNHVGFPTLSISNWWEIERKLPPPRIRPSETKPGEVVLPVGLLGSELSWGSLGKQIGDLTLFWRAKHQRGKSVHSTTFTFLGFLSK